MATRYATFQAVPRPSSFDLGVLAGASSALVSPGPTSTSFFVVSYDDASTNALLNLSAALSSLGWVFVQDSASAPSAAAQTRNYGALAANPSSPTPAKGDVYFNTTGNYLSVYNGTSWSSGFMDSTIAFVIDGGGVEIADGVAGDLQVDYDCTITAWTLLADQSGSIQIDIWKSTYAGFPPTVGNSITGSSKPTITATNKATSTTLTGWVTAIASGDVLRYNVDSCNAIQRCTVAMKIRRALFT